MGDVRLLYLRHGETDLNREQRMQGVTDAPLNAEGVRQVEAAAARLRNETIHAVYSSGLLRARETARIAAEPHGLPVVVDDRLREQDLGDWEAELWPELARVSSEEELLAFRSRLDHAPPGGESKRSVLARTVSFLDDLPARHGGQTVLAVGHGGPLLALMYHVLGIPDATVNRFYGGNGGLTEFAWLEEEGWRLTTFNERSHLG